MWEKSMEGLLSLVQKTTPSSFTYLCEKNGASLSHKVVSCCNSCASFKVILLNRLYCQTLTCYWFKYMQMDELACFVPGMLALGSFGYGPEKAEKFLELSKEVNFSSIYNKQFWLSYHLTSIGAVIKQTYDSSN